jgi:hypothetical protein
LVSFVFQLNTQHTLYLCVLRTHAGWVKTRAFYSWNHTIFLMTNRESAGGRLDSLACQKRPNKCQKRPNTSVNWRAIKPLLAGAIRYTTRRRRCQAPALRRARHPERGGGTGATGVPPWGTYGPGGVRSPSGMAGHPCLILLATSLSLQNRRISERDDPGPPFVPGGKEIDLESRNLERAGR